MNRLIHRSWGEGFVAAISLTHHANDLWISRFLFCQPIFLGIRKLFRFYGGESATSCAVFSWAIEWRTLERRVPYPTQP